MSSSEPVNVIAGWMASGMQPCSVSGASTPMPLAPEVCTTMVPGRTAPVAASPDTSARQFGVGDGEQQQLGPAGDLVDGQHRGVGQPALRALPRRLEMALHATTTCSARSSATPSAVPTRPAEMMPTVSRAGRSPSAEVPAGGGLHHRRRPR